jgi:uncharacterized membrane protein
MSGSHERRVTRYEVVLFGFDGVSTARDTWMDVRSEGLLEDRHVLAEALVDHAPSGTIHVHEPGAAGVGGAVGAVGGGFVAMFAGPVALPFLLVGGALLGGVAGHLAGRILPMADLREVAEALPLGSSAYVVLVAHDDVAALEEVFRPRGARIVGVEVDSEMAGVLGHDLTARLGTRDD